MWPLILLGLLIMWTTIRWIIVETRASKRCQLGVHAVGLADPRRDEPGGTVVCSRCGDLLRVPAVLVDPPPRDELLSPRGEWVESVRVIEVFEEGDVAWLMK